ncbi:peroxiredoxin [Roseibium sp. M-1]
MDILENRLDEQLIPSILLHSTGGSAVDLSLLSGLAVVYAYPRTSPPDSAPIEGWDQIPGARGCTPQCRGFAAHYQAILRAGATHVFGLSTQETAYQAEMKARLALPFEVLSDAALEFSTALGLPTFEAGGMTLLKRLTLIIEAGRIRQVFFPVEDPADNAFEVLTYLRTPAH